MYLQHYNFEHLPFRNTPDPRFFYETPRHNEALANLIYAVEQRRGFVLLSGEIGSGKTLVTHLLLKHIEDHAQIALVRNTHLNSSQLIRLICDEFGVQVPDDADKAAMLLALNQFLIQQLAEDRLVVVIIDEAQNLSDKVLEELRMLSNLETSSEKLLQIVIVGQPELRDKVSQPHLEQLRQRIALSYHLEPLTLEEIAAYMQHRMKIAGAGHTAIFTPEALAKIARFSRGTPRIINGLCDNALLYGFTAGTTTIDEKLIDKVLKHSMHLSPRQHSPTKMPVGGVSTPGAARPSPRPINPPGYTDVAANGAALDDKKKSGPDLDPWDDEGTADAGQSHPVPAPDPDITQLEPAASDGIGIPVTDSAAPIAAAADTDPPPVTIPPIVEVGTPVTPQELADAVTVGDDGSVERIEDTSPPMPVTPQTTSIAMTLPAARLFGT